MKVGDRRKKQTALYAILGLNWEPDTVKRVFSGPKSQGEFLAAMPHKQARTLSGVQQIVGPSGVPLPVAKGRKRS